MTTLTDRYVAETLRGIPRHQRADIEAELRTLIVDAVDDRVESGSETDAAERAVLADLGSPRRLAASYTDRPLSLIGPELYLDYLRVLTVLLSTVVPIWFLFTGITTFASGVDAITTLGAALYGAVETGMTIAFFTTVVFAVIERSRRMRSRQSVAWDPSSLPEVRDKRGYFAELIGGTAFFLIITATLIVLQTVGAVAGEGPIRAGLWDSGVFYLALFYAMVSISLHVVTWYTGSSAATAIATVTLDVLFAVPAVWLTASGRLLNPDYFDLVSWSDGARFGWSDGLGVVTAVVVVVVLLLSLMDSIGAIARAARSRTSTP